jgi:hypothetical protein
MYDDYGFLATDLTDLTDLRIRATTLLRLIYLRIDEFYELERLYPDS